MKNDEIRHKILSVLYGEFEENPTGPISREELMARLSDIDPKRIDVNMIYLTKKGFVRTLRGHGAPWMHTIIEPPGIDLVEDRSRFDVEFPPTSNLQIFQGDVGTVVQIGEIRTAIEGIGDVRAIVREEIKDSDLSEELEARLDELDALLTEKTIDKGEISKILRFFKANASWVVPILAQAVTKALGG